LRSEVRRLISKDRLVICDSLNYIKGFRYELFCIAKEAQTTYAVLYCDANEDTCQWLNMQKDETERYEKNVISELIARFEEPQATNRWDSPLFTIKIGTGDGPVSENDKNLDHCDAVSVPKQVQLPVNEIFTWLTEVGHSSFLHFTQTAPLMSADFLYFLDRITQKVVKSVVDQQRTAVCGDTFAVPNCAESDEKVLFIRRRSVAELSRLRRQFITYMKMHPIEDIDRIAQLFVHYLNANP
uniref:Protein KTI12 homolog n=1 Tax=Gongylonema pulchrum TaxID=637853 RepID=A0A183E3U8_9BILA